MLKTLLSCLKKRCSHSKTFSVRAGFLFLVMSSVALTACPKDPIKKAKPLDAKWTKGSSGSKGGDSTGGSSSSSTQAPRHQMPKVKNHPIIAKHTPGTGTLNPQLVVVQFSDYECPYCGLSHARLQSAAKKYAHKMRVYHRHFPLGHQCNRILRGNPYHKHSCEAAKAAVCAHKQNKFWSMHDALFRNQRSHHGKALMALAQKVGLSMGAFRSCMANKKADAIIKEDIEVSLAVGVDGTPTYVFFGPKMQIAKVSGLLPKDAFEQIFARLKKVK